jgi:ribosome-binding factor A
VIEMPKGMRPERLADALRAELSTLIAEGVKDPRVKKAGLATVTHVRVTSDLQHARILVSFVGGEPGTEKAAIEALQKTAGYLAGEATRRMNLRRAPALTFAHDDSAEHVMKIEKLLKGEE